MFFGSISKNYSFINTINYKRHKKRKIVAIYFRFIPIDRKRVLLYTCNGSMYKWLFLYITAKQGLNSIKVG